MQRKGLEWADVKDQCAFKNLKPNLTSRNTVFVDAKIQNLGLNRIRFVWKQVFQSFDCFHYEILADFLFVAETLKQFAATQNFQSTQN